MEVASARGREGVQPFRGLVAASTDARVDSLVTIPACDSGIHSRMECGWSQECYLYMIAIS